MSLRFKKNIFILTLSCCASFYPLTSSVAEIRDLADSLVRVAILKNVEALIIGIRSHYEIIDPLTEEVLDEGKRLKKSVVIATDDGIRIRNKEYKLNHIRIFSKKDITIRIDKEDRRFRGQIDIKKNKKGRFLVVNSLELEKYVKGVLYHEVSHRWPMEVTKAQAVATRTYALYQMRENADLEYDVRSDIYSQVYGGRSAERYRTNIAAKKTKGLVAAYQGEIFPAYYHANCGGHTENVNQLWEEDLPPLKGRECPFSEELPHSQWKRNIQLKEIQDKINARGYSLTLIKDIEILDRNESGRVKTLKISTRSGQTLRISAKRFREIVGPNKIKSNNYDIHMKGYYVDFIGKGWGHGVGMCQWGAYQMAQEQYQFREILLFYYPGINIVPYLGLSAKALEVDVDELRRKREEKKKRRSRR